jgi:hypothetical protein
VNRSSEVRLVYLIQLVLSPFSPSLCFLILLGHHTSRVLMTGEVVSLETVWTCVETAFGTHLVLLDIFFKSAEGDSD